MPISISISIPAYNEAETLRPLVLDALRVLASVTADYEVVIVDDGSRDGTGAIADALAGEHPQVRVLHHPRNLGFGDTLRDVFNAPTKEWMFFIPGDAQIPPAELHRLLPFCERYDFILGRRTQRRDTWVRRAISGGYNLLVSALLRRRVHDVDSVCLARRQAIQGLHLQSRSAFLHAELLLETDRQGFRWRETPIEHRERVGGVSKASKPGVLLKALRDMARYGLRRLTCRLA